MMERFFKKKRGKAGFTLIELLVTITIVGVISLTTFAIIISAMNTFNKQKDVMSAMNMKDTICLTIQDTLRRKGKIGLVSENLAEPSDKSVRAPEFGTAKTKDEFGDFVIDSRLMEYHMMYSDGGRIYTVTSNAEGKYYVDAPPTADALQAMPSDTKDRVSTTDSTKSLNGAYGRIPLMHESLYEGYYVDLKFRPIFTNAQGRYRDLQIIVTVYDDPSMTPEHQVSIGTETFHMLNVENRQGAIKFQNDTIKVPAEGTTPDTPPAGAGGEPAVEGDPAPTPDPTPTPQPNNKEPQPGGFVFCYFI